MTANQLKFQSLREEKRSNAAKEVETRRHNEAEETIDTEGNKIKKYSTDMKFAGDALKSMTSLIPKVSI